MSSIDIMRVKQGIIVVGVIIAIVGLGNHFLIPGTSRSGLAIQVGEYETATRNITLNLQEADYFFGIELLPPPQVEEMNITAYLLDAENYNLYISGMSLNDVDALLVVDNSTQMQYETSITDKINLYFVIQNNGSESSLWSYYYAVIPSTYYPSLLIGFAGVFTILLGVGWVLAGWKRYFIVGFGINAVLFVIRIFTLSTYSLGLPDIFWDLLQTEMYNDYQYFYLAWVPNIVEGAWPYSDAIYYYIYPPLWIYSVSILGNVPSWLPGLVLFTFNIAAGPLVYKITRQLTGDERKSIYAMLIYLLNPFTLIYGSFMWLNPTPFVFFITLSFYFAQKERETNSIIAIALATLYKQYAVVLFPIIAILFIKRKYQQGISSKFKEFIRHTLVYTLVIGLVSLPFLIVNPIEYVNRMIFWNTGNYDRLTYFIPDNWMTVHANTFFLWSGFPTWFTDTIAILLINYVFIILCGIIVYGTYAMMKTSVQNQEKTPEHFRELFLHAILWSFIAIMCIQLFYPRGAYKFYLLAAAPLFAVLFDYNIFSSKEPSEFKLEKHHLFPLVMSWIVLLCYRVVYFWVLVLWMGIMLWKSGDLNRVKENLKTILTLSFLKRPSEEAKQTEWDEIYAE